MSNSPWIFILIAGINSTIGNLLLKQSQVDNKEFIKTILSYEFIGGCFFYALNVLCFAYALKYLEVSKAYPVLASISFISLLMLSFIFFNEQITLRKILGISVTLVGIIILAR